MKKLSYLFSMVVLILSLNACGVFEGGESSPSKVKYPNSVQATWKDEFNQAEKLFESKQYGPAEKAYKDFINKYPYNELTDKSNFRLGQIAMLRQNYGQAVEVFKSIIQKSPDPAMKSKSNVKMAICHYRQKNFGEAAADLSAVEEKYIDEREKVKVGVFGVKSAQELKEDLNKKAYYYALLLDVYEPLSEADINEKFGSENISKIEVRNKFKEWVDLSTPPETIDRRLQKYRGKFSGPYLDYKLGKSYFDAKQNSKAQEYLKKYVSKNPNHDYVASAKKMLSSMGVSAPAVSNKGKGGPQVLVGVILPLSGKYEQYGNNILKGMQCGSGEKAECNGASNIRLLVKDSAGDPQKAAALVDELVDQDKVNMIVGPLTSSEVESVAKSANSKGIPLLALAQKKGIPELGENIFRFSLTPASQVEALLKYAANTKKAKRFGVLYPSSNYGQEFLAEFEKLSSQYGAKVISKQSFSATKSDLSDEVRQLKTSVSEVKQGTKIFDGIFIPDSYLTMAKLAPALQKSEIQDILTFGTNAWNDASLPSKIGSTLSNAFFVDIYFRDSSQSSVQTFVKEFQAAFNYPPSTLEAMGYDAARFLGQAFAGKKISKKEEIKPALMQVHGYQGATGLKGFLGDREAEVSPFILGVDANGIKEIQ
ncbi:MAG: penicillin-binding protein activator [Deltaproteobacteria bacterium]|nr:penicillin-binding protein activator [Deltaproteobacteria bacterium]